MCVLLHLLLLRVIDAHNIRLRRVHISSVHTINLPVSKTMLVSNLKSLSPLTTPVNTGIKNDTCVHGPYWPPTRGHGYSVYRAIDGEGIYERRPPLKSLCNVNLY